MPDPVTIDQMLHTLDEDLKLMADLRGVNDQSLLDQHQCVRERISERLLNPNIWSHFRT